MSKPRPVSLASPTRLASCAVLLVCIQFVPAPGAAAIAGGPCSLTCAADLTVPNDPASCDAAVDYPSPIILGACGPIVCTPPVGPFPLGPTTVTCAEATQATGSRGDGDERARTTALATLGPVPGASCTFDVTVVDTEPPAIVCPADQSVAAPIGGSTAIVDYPFPQISDNCLEIETPTCVPASGDSFPIGDTTTTCSTVDGAGNAASCTFVVSVTGGSPLEVPALTAGGLALLALLLAAAATLALRGR